MWETVESRYCPLSKSLEGLDPPNFQPWAGNCSLERKYPDMWEMVQQELAVVCWEYIHLLLGVGSGFLIMQTVRWSMRRNSLTVWTKLSKFEPFSIYGGGSRVK